MSEANRQTQSKDPVPAGATGADAGSFRIVTRFFDEHRDEQRYEPSRAAAIECSPQLALSLSKGRKPWVRK
jgi:hypothetical protein